MIGLDLSTVSTGVVIVKNNKVHKSYTIETKDKDVHKRIFTISKNIKTILSRIKSNVDVVIIESVYNIRWNTQSLLEIRGAIINILMELKIPYVMMSASEARSLTNAIPRAKKGTTYTRDEKKNFVKKLVELNYGVKFKNCDESDAALLCMAWSLRSSK